MPLAAPLRRKASRFELRDDLAEAEAIPVSSEYEVDRLGLSPVRDKLSSFRSSAEWGSAAHVPARCGLGLLAFRHSLTEEPTLKLSEDAPHLSDCRSHPIIWVVFEYFTAERTARSVGRKASVVGAASGGAAGLAAVSASGVVVGVSGAGIASGLAAIGGVVGGGMAAGTGIVIAAPAVAAAGVGYGAYRATRAVRQHTSNADDETIREALTRGADSARRAGGFLASRAKGIVGSRFSGSDEATSPRDLPPAA
jgi:hypothetical protein